MSIEFQIRDFAYPVRLFRLRRFFEKSQWLPLEELVSYQNKRLREIVRQAYYHVPYYRAVFDRCHVAAEDIRTVEDLKKLPFLTRNDVRSNPVELRADNAAHFHPSFARTSGTTGTPLRFLVDKPSNILEFAYYWRHWSWAGYRLGDRFADVRYDYFVKRAESMDVVWAYQPHLRRLLLNSMRIAPDRIVEYARALRKFKPHFIRARPISLYCLAQFLREQKLDDIQFQAAFTGGETVLPRHRQMIESTFGCRVLDSYGHMERCIAVSQCPAGGYHLHLEYGVLELADKKTAPDGTIVGRVVATSLHKMAMPFLRYEVDDLIELYPDGRRCPCGRALPLVKAVRGQKQDVILARDGRRIPSLFNVFHHVRGIRFFQMVQDDASRLVVRIVRGRDYTFQSEESLSFWLRRFIGDGMRIEVEYISESDLIVDESGRSRPVISRVSIW